VNYNSVVIFTEVSSKKQNKNIDDFVDRIKSRKQGLYDIETLFNDLVKGDKSALSKGITLVESSKSEDIPYAHQLLRMCLEKAGNSKRISITGTPGVGKSTFINTFARTLSDEGRRIAILSIDPTSYISGGSILGDKTRMDSVSGLDNVYIRPSATGDTLGGVHEKTREAILLCESAGYDHIIVETVGVGQSEYMVQRMTDILVLMMLPGSGDELQGIKKGIMEAADLILINKSDLFAEKTVTRSQADFRQAIHLAVMKESEWSPQVLTSNALAKDSVQHVLNKINDYFDHARGNGYLDIKRTRQWKMWFDDSLGWAVKEVIKQKGKHIRDYYPAPTELPPAKAMSMINENFNRS